MSQALERAEVSARLSLLSASLDLIHERIGYLTGCYEGLCSVVRQLRADQAGPGPQAAAGNGNLQISAKVVQIKTYQKKERS